MIWVAPGGWPDLHEFGGGVKGFEVRDEEHDEHEDEIDTNTRTHAVPVIPGGLNHPPKSNQTTRKYTRVEFLWRDQIASQMVELKE